MTKVKPKTKEQVIYFLISNISLGTYDKRFLSNLESMNVVAKKPLTTNQATLFEKIMYEGGQSSSFIEPKLHLTYYPGVTFKKYKTYNIYRADEIFAKDLKIDMVNLDVQGFELEVLKGFGSLLDSTKLIYSEINTAELYSGCVLIEQLDEFLLAYIVLVLFH